MMVHDQIETDQVIERYVRKELADQERRAFEEHFLGCTECFDKVQEMERFVAGVRYASGAGLLTTKPRPRWWSPPAFAAVAVILLIAGGVWVWSLRQSLDQAVRREMALARELQQTKAGAAALAETLPDLRAGNLPLAILDANRSEDAATQLTVPASAAVVALWIQVGVGSSQQSFAIDLSNIAGEIIDSVAGLKKNHYGALAVALPAKRLSPGTYTVRLSSENPRALLAQYTLKVTSN